MSLYNYGEEDVNVGGWRITVTQTANGLVYQYIIPANTVLSESGLLVIASRGSGSNFDVGACYGQALSDAAGVSLLYTSTLTYPGTRSEIRVYDAQNQLQDELMYDGMSSALPGGILLRAENVVQPNRPSAEEVSIQRARIVIEEGARVISRADYYAYGSERKVQLFAYLPEDYSETAPPSTMSTPVAEDLSLKGTVNGDAEYRTKTISSSQVIESGKSTYWAAESITFLPGFEVKAGAEFVAGVASDSVFLVKLMTYNLKGQHTAYSKHAEIIKRINPDVTAIQEVRGLHKYKILKEKSGYTGKKCMTIGDYGIALLYKESSVGTPLKVMKKRVATYDEWYEINRAYIVTEFRDFCFVSTHFSGKPDGRKKMANSIVGHKLVKSCMEKNKPVYIAGDLNEEPNKENFVSVPILMAHGFEILNDTVTTSASYETTTKGGRLLDMVLEYNTHPNHKTLYRGVPMDSAAKEQFLMVDSISDHVPYLVRVKVK